MNDWTDGYFTESTYTFGYYRELNPIYQRFCLLANGIDTPLENAEENHCELGFGQGVSINIHAAANTGKFFGTDFNPAHAAQANILCKVSKSGAKLFDNSFEEFLQRDDLPQFDSISLHGIWSWISTENQRHIVEFVKKFLKPGGVLYNSYNCYPGWSPAAPLRELFILHDKYSHQSSKTFNRVEEALNFTEKIISKAGYFQRVPDVQQIFDNTKKFNHDYLAHEYFNRDWICMYFNEVAEMFQAAKVDFACVAELVELKENFFLPADCIELLNKIENPIMREQVKDYFLNRQFRKDISVRGAIKISPLERMNRVLNTIFVLNDRQPLPENFKIGVSTINLNPDLREKIYEYLAGDNFSPKTFKEFNQKNPQIPLAALEEVLLFLVHSNKISPCQNVDAVKKVEKNCRALNEYICERAKFSDDIQFLASPLTGGGVQLGRFERIFTSAIWDGKNSVDEIANYAWNIFKSTGQVLAVEGKTLQTPEENIAAFSKDAKNFIENRLPALKILKIV